MVFFNYYYAVFLEGVVPSGWLVRFCISGRHMESGYFPNSRRAYFLGYLPLLRLVLDLAIGSQFVPPMGPILVFLDILRYYCHWGVCRIRDLAGIVLPFF